MSSSERWLPVVGYESRYEISSHGRLRVLFGSSRGLPGRLLTGWVTQGSYLVTELTKTAGQPGRHARIHVLVLEAFVGPRPKGFVSRHLDGNPQNNRLDNLAWGTYVENAADRDRHGRTSVKLSPDDVRAIRRLRGEGLTHVELARRFGVSTAQAGKIARGLSQAGIS